ncbi:hypothetical protein KO528_01365 [Saccharophagus degradans]|uniref:hypothetical protein n=1 Tax=Saccharophagus degradans TaxID=86304 RepID=UPI001C0939C3|nr:hypothetical protein [Saccharophagus degradans]MBU2983986.1 hypothetical protein [Saccharophagus degradans]
MNKVELMQIEDTFLIKSIGLVLAPSFDLPPEGKWVNISEVVTIKTPDGNEVCADALFSVAHLNIKDPSVSVNQRWPILLSLRGIKQEAVPVGSKVYVSPSTKKAVAGGNA